MGWWGRLYTRAAPPAEAADRQAEVASDMYEQLAAARAARAARGGAGGAPGVLGRAARGVPAPGRPQWHLAHPGTVLGGSVLLLLPLDLIEDVARERGDVACARMVGGATGLLSALVVAFVGLLELACRVRNWSVWVRNGRGRSPAGSEWLLTAPVVHRFP